MITEEKNRRRGGKKTNSFCVVTDYKNRFWSVFLWGGGGDGASIDLYPSLDLFVFRNSLHDPQDLDLLSEPLSSINQRLINNSNRSASFTISPLSINSTKRLESPSFINPIDFHPRQSSHLSDGRSRHNGPLAATTNQIYHPPHRTFPLNSSQEMKPIDELLFSHTRRRPCHRQNALRYKSIDQDATDEHCLNRYSSRKSASFDIHDELRPADISWSVREKAKLFEHPPRETRKLSTGRENYV